MAEARGGERPISERGNSGISDPMIRVEKRI